ncbi:MAG TPA: PAS domain-containing protein [Longimicrobium sp.]|jgi:PAS domain S-box-containing protein|nr:PAS domain-containing protein [Longimicrobium sp.]
MIEALLEHVSDGILILDADWRVVEMNRRAELLLRRRRGEVVGQVAWQALPDVAESRFEAEVKRVATTGLAAVFKFFYPSLYSWHNVRAVPSEGRVLLFLSDVTEIARKQQTEAVREAVRELVRQAPLAISVVRGPEHRFEVVNEMGRRLLKGRELEGLTARAALPELEGQGLFELLDEVYRTGQPFQGREIVVRYDPSGEGELVTGVFNVMYQPLFESDGRVSGVLSLSVDVTELVAERNRLANATREMAAVLDQIGEGVIVTDSEGRIRMVNEVARRLHGTDLLDVAPEEYADAYHLFTEDGLPYPSPELPLARAVLHGQTVTGARWRIRRPDGTEVLVEGNARPVQADDGTRLAAVLTLWPADPASQAS